MVTCESQCYKSTIILIEITVYFLIDFIYFSRFFCHLDSFIFMNLMRFISRQISFCEPEYLEISH
jgi:hypothetical protein